MQMKHYIREWLVGVGRADLARKADADELPELKTPEARECFARFQQGKVSPSEFLHEIMGLNA